MTSLPAILSNFEKIAEANYKRCEEVNAHLMKEVKEISESLRSTTDRLGEKEKEILTLRLEYETKLANQRRDSESILAAERARHSNEATKLSHDLHQKQLSLIKEATQLSLTLSAVIVEARETPKLKLQLMEKDKEIAQIALDKDKEIARLSQERDRDVARVTQEKDREILRLSQDVERLQRALSSRSSDSPARIQVSAQQPTHRTSTHSEFMRTLQAKSETPSAAPYTPAAAQVRPAPQAPTLVEAESVSVDRVEEIQEGSKEDHRRVVREDGKRKPKSMDDELLAEASKFAARVERRGKRNRTDDTPRSDTHRGFHSGDGEELPSDGPDYSGALKALADNTRVVPRELATQHLQKAWENVQQGHATSALVYGHPGSGKTCLVQDFFAHTTAARKTVLVVTVNCRAEKKKEKSIYLRILEAFSNLPQTSSLRLTDNGDSHDPKAAFNRALHILVGRFVPVIICDEVDAFGTETVITLLEPSLQRARVLVIGISNDLTLGTKIAEDQRMNNIELIQFSPYTAEELANIVRARLEMNPHYTQLFPSDALIVAAQREAKRKSDARIFLDLCKKSLLAARDQGAPHVTTDIVLITDGANYSDEGPASTLSPQHVVILIALLRRSHNGAAVSVDQVKATVENMRTGIYQNRTPAEWLNALETLDSAGFVSLNLDAHPKMVTPRTTWEVVRRLAEGKLSHLLNDDDMDL